GPAVADLAGIFTEDWYFATEETIRLDATAPALPVGPATVAALPSGPDQDHNASALVYFGGIAGARERVWLTSPYFIPDEPTLRALEETALRGVDVRLLVPAESDAFLVGPAGRSYFPTLLKAGVRVFEYLPSLLHAKTMVVDAEWSFVGSANLDIRSFRLNFELGALVADPEFARLLEEKFHDQARESREVTMESLAARGIWIQVVEHLARLLSPLL
ncbi:MAG TPA: phospholipase D-like domain-containing protein, partial [Geobacteraceae bacterium]